jgi:hypothetical protein
MVQAYCVKCKKKGVEMKTPEITMTSKGGYMAKGQCPACGTMMCAMMSKDNADKALKAGAKKSY